MPVVMTMFVKLVIALGFTASVADHERCSPEAGDSCVADADGVATLQVAHYEKHHVDESAEQVEEAGQASNETNIIANCGEPPQSFDVSMACIARATYNFPLIGKQIAGWDLKMETVDQNGLIGTDKMSIYRNSDGICALAISGSDDALDWIQDFKFFPTSACGLNLHRGFYEEAARLTSSTQFYPMVRFLKKKCTETWVVGHGRGGAVASTMAACWAAKENKFKDIPLTGLYTFGAPGIADTAATSRGGKCFEGYRFFNLDIVGGDPVPAVTHAVGLKHPHIKTIRLFDAPFVGASRDNLACEQPATCVEPHFGIIPMPAKHLMSFYINRIKATA